MFRVRPPSIYLPGDVKLRNGGPLRVVLDSLSNGLVTEHIDSVKVNIIRLQNLRGRIRESNKIYNKAKEKEANQVSLWLDEWINRQREQEECTDNPLYSNVPSTYPHWGKSLFPFINKITGWFSINASIRSLVASGVSWMKSSDDMNCCDACFERTTWVDRGANPAVSSATKANRARTATNDLIVITILRGKRVGNKNLW